MSERAQAAIEYLLLVAVVLAVLVPASYMFYDYSKQSSTEIKTSQVNKIGNEIVDRAEEVYYMGPPATVKFEAQMPDNVRGMWIATTPNGYVLVFNVTTDTGYINQVAFPVSLKIDGSFGKASYSQGLKNIRLEAKEDDEGNKYVWVSTKGKCTSDDDCAVEEQCLSEECVLCAAPVCGPCYSAVPHCGECVIDDSAGGCQENEYCFGGECVPCEAEICDGRDNDCDSIIDNGCDDDNDEYCDSAIDRMEPYSCSDTDQCCPTGGEDCDDLNEDVNLGATEVCGNDIDENCDGWYCISKVSESADDAFGINNGANYYTYQYLMLGIQCYKQGWSYVCSNYDSGFRFQNVQIHQGAIIQEAKLRTYVFSTTTPTPSTSISGERLDSGNNFGQGSQPIYSRQRTYANVNWNPLVQSGWQETPDIKTVVQELVDRAGWQQGNAMSILVINNFRSFPGPLNNRIQMRAYDYSDKSLAAELWVKYTPG